MIRVTIFIIFFSNLIFPQSNLKLGRVTKEELSKTTSEQFPGAEAEVLFEIGKTNLWFNQTYFNFVATTEVITKIKIYNKKGYRFAKISIPIYKRDSEVVTFSKAFTYNLVDNKIVKTRANYIINLTAI